MDLIKKEIIRFLDEPANITDNKSLKRAAYFYSFFIVILILLAPINLILTIKTPELVQQYQTIFTFVDHFVLTIFSLDLLLRLFVYKQKFKYLFSFNGFVDVIAVVPSLLTLFFSLGISTSWLRILRLFRLGKVLNLKHEGGIFGGFNGKLIWFSIGLITTKSLIMLLEDYSWWITFENPGTLMSIVSFAVAVLLGTKLSVVNTRLYAIEDAISKIVGCLKIMWHTESLKQESLDWAIAFEKAIVNPSNEDASSMRVETNRFFDAINTKSSSSGNTVNFSRDVAYVIHRINARSPIAYENLLKFVTFSFVAAVLIVIPGISGLASTLLVSYVFLGVYFLIDDIDRPLDYGEDSLIQANLEELQEFIKNHK